MPAVSYPALRSTGAPARNGGGGPCRQPPPGWQEEKWISLPSAPPPPLPRLFELSPPTPVPGSSLASSSGKLNLPAAQLSSSRLTDPCVEPPGRVERGGPGSLLTPCSPGPCPGHAHP